MKIFKYSILAFLVGLLIMTACDPQEDPTPGTGGVPTEQDAAFTYTADPDNPNIINFKTSAPGFKADWDFGNGAKATGTTATGKFAIKGEYTVTLTIFTKGGQATSSQKITIAETNPIMLDIPSYNFLTGGSDALEGKTWVVDSESAGHLGVGPVDATSDSYYSAPPGAKAGKGLYDDEMTFQLSGFTYTHKVNNDVYVNGAFSGNFPGAVKENGGDDFIAPYMPKAATWNLAENADGTYTLTLSNGEFMGYYGGAVATYTILSLTADEMYVKQVIPSASLTWFQRFIRKGFVREVVPPEYKIQDMNNNFEGAGNITFASDGGGSLTTYDNPATFGLNTSAKVGKYVKADGQANQFSNVQAKFDFKLDITKRHKFRLKAFIPAYNDYTTTGGEPWQSYNTLQKQVSVKLQNSELGGNAYTTQAEVIQKNLPTDQWVELEFDFSAFAAREDFDKVIIQIGGEAIVTGGTFFIDDFELLPE